MNVAPYRPYWAGRDLNCLCRRKCSSRLYGAPSNNLDFMMLSPIAVGQNCALSHEPPDRRIRFPDGKKVSR